MKFKLLRGIHQQSEKTGEACPICDGKGRTNVGLCSPCKGSGKELISTVYESSVQGKNIIESHLDLERIHGFEKFQNLERIASESGNDALISELNELRAENARLKLQKKESDARLPSDDLGTMDKSQLREYANSYDPPINLEEASGVVEMANVIREELDAA